MIFSSDVCAELEDNSINIQECEKCERVSHNICSNNMIALYLQRDIHLSTISCSQACMISMDQATPKDRNEEILAIERNIEVYNKWFNKIHRRNSRIKNMTWCVFPKCKKLEDEYFFFSECYKKEPYPPLARNRGVFNKIT